MIPWSYSFLRDFANCPQKAYRKYIKKDLPKEDSPELREGITTHTLLENYLKTGGLTRLPVNLEMHARPLLRPNLLVEVMMGMTIDQKPATFFKRDGVEPWGRGKADVLILDPPTALIIDWKTGKVREDDRELRQLALLVKANHPEIERAMGCYVWLKEGKWGPLHDVSDTARAYNGTLSEMEMAAHYERENEWPVNPNALCGWCPVADCRFNTNDRIAK